MTTVCGGWLSVGMNIYNRYRGDLFPACTALFDYRRLVTLGNYYRTGFRLSNYIYVHGFTSSTFATENITAKETRTI